MVARSLFTFLTRLVSDVSLDNVLANRKNSRAPDSLENVIIEPSVLLKLPSSISTMVWAEFTQRMADADSMLNPVTYGILP